MNGKSRLLLILLALALAVVVAHGKGRKAVTKSQWSHLSPEERRVIEEKGTERPFSGTYVDHKAAGSYVCKGCGAALYRSTDKFDSGCGWPAFDDEIEGAVRRQRDGDGRRTEILCARCGGHLGHVFEGEGLTRKNVRHCVNSISLDFLPAARDEGDVGRAIFAGGCFWGIEYWMKRQPGVLETSVGYTGGHLAKPRYRQVCDGGTGHFEAVELRFDPARTSFETLARVFFEIHDPTQADGQGPDIGSQYLSAIFVLDESQRKLAEELVGTLRNKGYDVVTRILPVDHFWPAEDHHQNYYEKKGSRPYCHMPQKRF